MARDSRSRGSEDDGEQLDFGVGAGFETKRSRDEDDQRARDRGDSRESSVRPLADRVRPHAFDEVVGQEHLTGSGAPLRRFLETGRVPSLILWGPPGSGKTTIGRILATAPGHAFEPFSAVTSGVKDVRAAIERARERVRADGTRTLLFVDEIHRFNRGQQDAFLPHVEAGTIVLVGATTENPSFHVNAALLSRCRVYVLNSLPDDALLRLGKNAVAQWRAGVAGELAGETTSPIATGARDDVDAIDDGKTKSTEGRDAVPLPEAGVAARAIDDAASTVVTDDGWAALLAHAQGDARRLLSALEVILGHATGPLDDAAVRSLLQSTLPRRLGDEDHFDWISALQKSIRGSDPHAAVYWLARLLVGGEEPLYLARRLVRTASEDIGLADPAALALANSAREAVQFLGMPEAEAALAQCAIYLALAPKSNSAIAAFGSARDEIERTGPLPVPLRLRNASTRLLKEQGYGEGYQYAHDHPGHWVPESYLPDAMRGSGLYEPSRQGREGRMVEDHARRTRDYYGLLRPGSEVPARPPGSGVEPGSIGSPGMPPEGSPNDAVPRNASLTPPLGPPRPDTGEGTPRDLE